MTWATPWAWALALAIGLPLVAHLWSRRQPTPQPFSTLRFLRAASPVSRRLRHVQDWPLLLLRTAIVMAIAAAAAGPTLATARRLEAWRGRVHRVIVVEPTVAASAATTVAEWQRSAASSEVLPAGPPTLLLPEAIARAAAAARDGRAEIALAWSGRATAVPPRALAAVPAHVGVRLAAIAPPGPVASAGRIAIEATTEEAPLAARLRGIVSPPTVRSAVMVRVLLPGVAAPATATGPATPEARALLDALASDPRVRAAAERSGRDPRAIDAGDHARPLAFDAEGRALLAGWASGDTVHLTLAATPGSPLALWALTVAREALERPDADAEALSWTPDDIARATRDAQPPATARLPSGLDTRWAWAVALLLLLVEQWWRRRPTADADAEEARDAA